MKKIPYWLRGGVISLVIVSIINWLLYICADGSSGLEYLCAGIYVEFSPATLAMWLINSFSSDQIVDSEMFSLKIHVVNSILWFMIGALIGLRLDYVKKEPTRR